MSPAEPWPLSIVTGFLGSGKTTLIAGLLRRADMTDTVVIVNEFGEIGLDHHLLKPVTDRVVLLPNGCLCCTIREDVIQTLRDLHRAWLADAIPDFGRVLVETTGLAEPAPLLASVVTHPLLADVFALRAVVTVVDADYGLDHMDDHPACRQQIYVADHLVISKCDLVSGGEVEVLQQRLVEANPLASVRRFPAEASPDFLFERTARPARSSRACVVAPDHLAPIETLVLRAEGPLSWRRFQVWINDLLERFGSLVLRVKGCLIFDEIAAPMIVQTVHQTFYPITEAPDHMDMVGGFLVLMSVGPLESDVALAFDRCRIQNDPDLKKRHSERSRAQSMPK